MHLGMDCCGAEGFPVGAVQAARHDGEWACPVFGVFFDPVEHFKGFCAGFFDDGVAPGGAIEDFLVFGVDAAVFANDDIDVQVNVDEFARCAGVVGCGQDDITVAVGEAPVGVIGDMYSLPKSTPASTTPR